MSKAARKTEITAKSVKSIPTLLSSDPQKSLFSHIFARSGHHTVVYTAEKLSL